jgi:voltage-gated potassium channel
VRGRRDTKTEVLASVPLFSGLGRRHLERIGQLCTRVNVDPGAVLCREGASGREFFVVLEGTAAVSMHEVEVGALGPGDFFGELALFDGGPRTATVTATTAMSLLVLSSPEFAALLNEEPAVAVKMLPAIGARIRSTVEAAQRPGAF